MPKSSVSYTVGSAKSLCDLASIPLSEFGPLTFINTSARLFVNNITDLLQVERGISRFTTKSECHVVFTATFVPLTRLHSTYFYLPSTVFPARSRLTACRNQRLIGYFNTAPIWVTLRAHYVKITLYSEVKGGLIIITL